MKLDFGYLQKWSAVVLVLATFTRVADSRLPPKLLKAASGAGKALYARGYGYSVIPIPQKILLQANLARREVHHPRPPRRTKRPRRGKRPPPPGYASKYQEYSPSRKRRPQQNHIREQEFEGPDEDFEYEDRGYKEFEDFVAEHSKLYADGYNTRGKPSRGRVRDEEPAFTENKGYYAGKPRPSRSGRPSTKLYSAAIAFPNRDYREESDYEEEEYEREQYSRGRPRYREEEDEEEDHYWDPDNVYHDRKYTTKQDKFRRAVDDKPRRPSTTERNRKLKAQPSSERPVWIPEDKWEPQEERESYPPYDKNRWKTILQTEDQMRWREPAEEKPQTWRNPGSLGIGKFLSKEPEDDFWKEPEIITKQNAVRWGNNGRHQEEKERQESWTKEHSVGYGIEIDGGGGGGRPKPVREEHGDVVYGQASGSSGPRVPDLGYGQGMEIADKPLGWQVYLR